MGQREIILHTLSEISMQILKALPPQDTQNFDGAESAVNTETAETVPNEVRTIHTTSSRMSEPFRAEKPLQNIAKLPTPRGSYREAEETARYLYELKKSYVLLEQSRFLLKLQHEKDTENIPQLDARANTMEKKIGNLDTMRGYVAELKIERRNLPSWKRKRKRELGEEIERIEADIRVAENYFNSEYHIPLHQASYEIDRLRNEARFKERELERKSVRMEEIGKELDAIEAEYRAQLELAEKRADMELIENLLSNLEKSPTLVRGNLRQAQIERKFDSTNRKKKGKT
jgi:vacuolar-type H+-ATPase subunit I/STV1